MPSTRRRSLRPSGRRSSRQSRASADRTASAWGMRCPISSFCATTTAVQSGSSRSSPADAARPRLRQLHLTAVSSPVRRRRDPVSSVSRPSRDGLRLHRRGALDRRLAAAGQSRGRGARSRSTGRSRSGSQAASVGVARLGLTMPVLVDDMDDAVEQRVRRVAGAHLRRSTATRASRTSEAQGPSSSTRTQAFGVLDELL